MVLLLVAIQAKAHSDMVVFFMYITVGGSINCPGYKGLQVVQVYQV